MKLTKLEKRRVAIAKDALGQLKLEKFIAQNMTYTEFLDKKFRKTIRLKKNKDFGAKECLLENDPKCKVCAKGALFLSTIRKENHLKVVDLSDSGKMEDNSAEIFGEGNLNRMEAAFENWQYSSKYSNRTNRSYTNTYFYGSNIHPRISAFYHKYNDATDRLKAILENVIRNKGTFKL